MREGGDTRFTRMNLRVAPRKGAALVFFPADARTWEADGLTEHEGSEAVDDKWIAQLFGRGGRKVPAPLGIPNDFVDVIEK